MKDVFICTTCIYERGERVEEKRNYKSVKNNVVVKAKKDEKYREGE